MQPSVSYRELGDILTKLGAKLEPRQVHALYLGALTSTNLRLGPQQLLEHLFADNPVLGASTEEANAALQVLFGYWNTLVTAHHERAIHLAPEDLPMPATRGDLIAYSERRQDDIVWFTRGIDAGGDDPIEFGAEGQKLLERIAEGSGYLALVAEQLGRQELAAPQDELQKTRASLREIVATLERCIGDLMAVSDRVRRAAVATFEENAGRATDDGARITSVTKVGRNDPCPCGSGKKWKKCHGGPAAPRGSGPVM